MNVRADWGPANIARLVILWAGPLTTREIAAEFGDRNRNAIIGKAHALGLPPKPRTRRKPPPTARPADTGVKLDGLGGHVRKAFASKGDDCTLSRWVKTGRGATLPSPRQMSVPSLERPAIANGRSIFHRKGVKAPAGMSNVLVSGHNNVKIGRDVRKGPLRGYWIYTLSLEERATCPRSCFHWQSCYGNNMPYAKRVDHRDPAALEAAIERDIVRLLSVKGRVGILVRLHALGDFYSVEYVDFWRRMLAEHPRLSVFGYTARLPGTPIGDAMATLIADQGARFAIRFSNAGYSTGATMTVRTLDRPVNATLCPEQTGKTAACATCGLCFGRPPVGNIAFLEH